MTDDGQRPHTILQGWGAGCLGCKDHPDVNCAACGATAIVALDASNMEGEHTMVLCARCFALLLEVRKERRADHQMPLVYVSLEAPATYSRHE